MKKSAQIDSMEKQGDNRSFKQQTFQAGPVPALFSTGGAE